MDLTPRQTCRSHQAAGQRIEREREGRERERERERERMLFLETLAGNKSLHFKFIMTSL